MNYFAIHLKPAQYCTSSILQFKKKTKINKTKKKKTNILSSEKISLTSQVYVK